MKVEETKITISNVELPDEIKKEYKKIVDVLIYLDEKVVSNTIINRSLYSNVKQRNCVYFGKLHGLSLKEGQAPKSLKEKRLYQLNLNANIEDNKYGEDVYMLKGERNNEPLIENYAIFVKNIAFYHNLYYNKHKKLTKREMWLVALSCNSFSELYKVLIQILDKDKVQKFMESVIIMSQEDMILKDWERKQLDELVEYTTIENAKERGYSDGEAKGMAKGMAKGIAENKIEIAKKMLNENLDISLISKVTDLSIKEIENLQ